MTWRGRSTQCCTCSKWIHVSALYSPNLNSELLVALTPGASPLLHPYFFWRFQTYQHCDFLFGLFRLVYLHCSIWPPSGSISAIAKPPLHPRLQDFYPPSAHFVSPFSASSPHRLMLLAISLSTTYFLFPLTPLEFFNGMLEVSEPGAPNFCTFSRLTLLTLFVSRNLTFTHLPFSGFLDSLFCDLIAPTPSLAFSLLIPHALAAAPSFLLSRAYPSLNFLSPIFFCLTPTLII